MRAVLWVLVATLGEVVLKLFPEMLVLPAAVDEEYMPGIGPQLPGAWQLGWRFPARHSSWSALTGRSIPKALYARVSLRRSGQRHVAC